MTEIRSTNYFAIIPEWILHSDISANAIRLYCVLNRYANQNGQAWPSRKSIADLMRISVATVDRAKDELVGIRALTVEARKTPSGDPSSNLYTLITEPPKRHSKSSPVSEGTPTREERGTPTSDEQYRDSMNDRKIDPPSCETCRGRFRHGWRDGTDGLSHIPQDGDFIVCPECAGTGKSAA